MDGIIVKSVPITLYPAYTAFDGLYIWVLTTYPDTRKIHQVNKETGEVLYSFETPIPYVQCFCADELNLWLAEEDIPNNRTNIYCIDKLGNILKTLTHRFTIPVSISSDGRTLWLVGDLENEVSQIDYNGNELFTFALPAGWPGPIAFANKCLWLYDVLNLKLRQLDWNGNVLNTISLPIFLSGLAWDDKHLWSSDIYPNILIQVA